MQAPVSLNIALDYDETYTADPAITELNKRRGWVVYDRPERILSGV
jgi:hypothetical protein